MRQKEELVKTKFVEKYANVIGKSDSEYKLLISSSFLFYKEFMSSQDGANCSFSPSCSEYAVLALKKKGLIQGGLMFFDRYTRCNSPKKKWYKVDEKKQRLLDPIE